MSDIFHEVDEEVRREQLKQLWNRYGTLIIAGAILIVLAVGAWRGYQWWQAKRAAELGAQFDAAAVLAEQGKHEEAQAAFARLAAQATPGYRALARLRQAAELGQRDLQAAVALYDEIASDAGIGQPLQDLAAIRAGLLLVDTAPYDEMARRLEPLTAVGAPFRNTARELLALAAWRANDHTTVRRWAELIRTDGEAPPSIRRRIEVLLALIDENGKG